MVKFLYGSELTEFIKVRQLKQVRRLRQADKIKPKLLIIVNSEEPVIKTYVNLKQKYGEEIGVDVEVQKVDSDDTSKIINLINNANQDETIHGIIVQLPLGNMDSVQEVVNTIAPEKDVDGLAASTNASPFISATAEAINWLLAGYNVDVKNKKIAIVGAGRLVGGPLFKMWQASGYNVTVFDKSSEKMQEKLINFDIIISGVGQPSLIKPEMVQPGAVVVDAGTTSEGGTILGDVAEEVYKVKDIKITPRIGGVGPLTVAALFDHVIQAANHSKQP